MSTVDQTLTNDWTKIADASESFMLSVHGDTAIAVAYMDTETAPTVTGHVLNARYYGAQGYVRANNIPPGFAYAKTMPPGHTAVVGLSVWTE